jgi:hypothetical protein
MVRAAETTLCFLSLKLMSKPPLRDCVVCALCSAVSLVRMPPFSLYNSQSTWNLTELVTPIVRHEKRHTSCNWRFVHVHGGSTGTLRAALIGAAVECVEYAATMLAGHGIQVRLGPAPGRRRGLLGEDDPISMTRMTSPHGEPRAAPCQ